jgi:L-2-hydroxyglutarate oxidase
VPGEAVHDVAIVGGGIVGMAVAMALTDRYPGADIVVLEKEPTVASHQTGRNSGVIHSGVYYRPGTLKAQLSTSANRTMVAFCQEHGIRHEVRGKLIVATRAEQLPGLDELEARGKGNNIPVRRLTPAEINEREPHLRCVAALEVPTAGVVDYRAVTEAIVSVIADRGVAVELGARVEGIDRGLGVWRLRTPARDVQARFLVTCGGLQSDRLSRAAGSEPGAQIVPFRGEYYDVIESRRHLVNGLIYPVPDLRFPFLGVHLTRGIHGDVHAGPNAVLAFAREGYRWRDVSPRDLAELVRYAGFWRMARRNAAYGASEMMRSLVKERFVRSVQELVPDLRSSDLTSAPAGVRAQAVDPSGGLVDDFRIVADDGAVHVVNAPSPAATASLEIARHVVSRLTL